jgi:putative hydrolase of the HAD superfamily
MPPRAVLFDLDDTLFDAARSMLDALTVMQSSFPAFGHLTPTDLLALQRRTMLKLDPLVFAGELDARQARVRRFELMLSECGDPAPDGEAAQLAYRAAYRASFREVAGAGALLRALRGQGVRVGVLTNYLREVQLDTLEVTGLLPHVEALVTVSEAPPKPHPGSYAAACAALGVPAAQTVMVGDSWPNDVAGAVAAGLQAV